MARRVKTLVRLVTLPGYGRVDEANTTITLTDEQYDAIPDEAFSGSKVEDLGPVDNVVTQAAFQAQVAAITSVAAAGANPTKAEYDALRNDVIAIRTTLNGLLTKLQVAGGPQASS
jgi:hypothetical protein